MNVADKKIVQNRAKSIRFILPGPPTPLARPRMTNHHMYDSQKHDKLKARCVIENQYLEQGQDLTLLAGPLNVQIDFYFPMPKSSAKRHTEMDGTHHVFKPDISNCIKFIEDVMTGLIYHDDSSIAEISSKKVYSLEPRTEIMVFKIGK